MTARLPTIFWYYSLWRQKDKFWNSLPASGLCDGVNAQRISDWWFALHLSNSKHTRVTQTTVSLPFGFEPEPHKTLPWVGLQAEAPSG